MHFHHVQINSVIVKVVNYFQSFAAVKRVSIKGYKCEESV